MNGFPYTRITIFHILWLICLVGFTALGFYIGLHYFGITGVIISTVIGIVIGHIIGNIPDQICLSRFFKHLNQSSKEELRAIVAADDWKFNHTMALLKLGAMGEEVRQEIPRIVAMLESDSKLSRIYGWDALRIVFTEESRVIEDYKPRHSTEKCRRKTEILKDALVKGTVSAALPIETPPGKEIQKERFSWIGLFLIISFFAIAVTIGLLLVSTRKPTDSLWGHIFAGAFVGFFCTWLSYFTILRLYLCIIRGYPFNIGDWVEIIKGPHKDKIGTILMSDKEQGVFKINISIQSDQASEIFADLFEIRKLRKK